MHTRIITAVWSTVLALFLASCASPDPPGSETVKAYPEALHPSPPPAEETESKDRITAASPSGAGTPAPQRARFFPGTGRFINADTPPRDILPGDSQGDVTLNFIDVDIRGLVDAILGEMFGYNYVIDPSINGTVTLQTANPVSRADVLPALETVLQLNDAAIVEREGLMQVVPLSQAPKVLGRPDMPTHENRNVPGFRVQVVPLRYTGAAEMAKVLEPFAPAGGILKVDPARNQLLIAGTTQDLETMRQAIHMFDVDWLQGMSFALFKLQYTEPQALITELREIIAGPDSPVGDLIRLIPIPRLKSILVITPQEDYLRKTGTWIQRLDIGGDDVRERRIYVYHVQNGRADDLASALNKVISLTPEPVDAPDDTSEPAPPDPSSFTGNTSRVIPNMMDNTLLILATPREYRVIEAALQRMDVAPRQVLIEAVLAEVNLTDELRYGVQWFFESGDHSVTLSSAPSGSTSPEFPGFSYVFSGSADSRVVLNALSSVTNVDVISAPKLLVLDNQTANLQVGDQVPVVTQSAVSVADPDAPLVNSIQFRDTGVILNVTPHVNSSGSVLIEVAQELSEVAPTTTSGIDSPTIQQRKVQSTVIVQSGETVALGGLIRERRTQSRSGIPLLKDIPLLGNAFKTSDNQTRRTELLVLITPRIIRNSEESRQVMTYLRDQFLSLEPFRIEGRAE